MTTETIVEVGDKVKCKVTQIEGIVTVRHDYLYGCSRVGIQPEGEAEGKAKAAHHTDIYQVDIVTKHAVTRNGLIPKSEIALGDDIEDRISGFKGVCTGMAEWLYACTKVCITPREINKKTGKPVDSTWFDEPQVQNVNKPKPKDLKEEPVAKRTGGFDKSQSDSSFNHSSY